MRIAPLLIAAAFLAGCNDGAGPREPAPAPPVPDGPAEQPFYIGRWAAEEAMCANAAWVFAADRLETPGEVACTFEHVTPVREGYEIAAVCTAEAPPAPYRIRLSYAQSAQALLVEDGPFNPVGLIRCD